MVETIPIYDVDIELTYPDDSTETFTLEAPNADNPFEIEFKRINILPPYRDGNYTLQKGFEKYQILFSFDYQSHRMDLFKLMAAENIAIKVPPVFSNDVDNNYQRFNVFLENNEVLRNWLSDLPVGSATGTILKETNPIPGGSANLRFVGVTPFTEAEILGDDPNPDDDNNRPIEWNQGAQNTGALYRVTGFLDTGLGFDESNTLQIAREGTGTALFILPEAADFILTFPFYQTRKATTAWSGGGQSLHFDLNFSSDDVYTDVVIMDPSPNCDDPLIFTLTGGMPNWEGGNINNTSENDNPTLRFYHDGTTVSTLCTESPFEFDLLIRFIGLSDADITINEATAGIANVELIEDFQ